MESDKGGREGLRDDRLFEMAKRTVTRGSFARRTIRSDTPGDVKLCKTKEGRGSLGVEAIVTRARLMGWDSVARVMARFEGP